MLRRKDLLERSYDCIILHGGLAQPTGCSTYMQRVHTEHNDLTHI